MSRLSPRTLGHATPRRRRPGPRAAALAAAALVLSACGGAAGAVDGVSVSGDFGDAPEVEVDGLDVEEAESAVLIEGDGEEITTEDAVRYRFLIAKGTDGETVSDNYRDNDPQRMIPEEQPDVIADAVEGATVGSRVLIAMPVRELLGDQGAPNVGLDADDDLVMVLDLVELAATPLSGPEGEKVDPPATAPTVVEEDDQVTGFDFSGAPSKPPGKLQVIPLVEGEGEKVEKGDQVTVDYLGAVWGNEEKSFDDSYSREPATFGLEEGRLIDGWVQGLEGVEVGSRVLLVIPPKLGYGAQGSGEDIPPDSTLVFVIDVLGTNL